MSNQIFPVLPGLTWSVTKTPQWSTRIQKTVSGREYRAAFYNVPLYTFKLTYEFLRAGAEQELQTLMGFFNARQGSFDSFLYADPTDNSVTAQSFGTGDGTTTKFQLLRTMGGYAEPIQNINTKQVYRNDWQGNQTIYDLSRTNILKYTEDLHITAGWTLTTGTTVSPNMAQAPDGTFTADRVDYNGGGASGDYRIYSVGITSLLGVPYCGSIWLRADTATTVRINGNTVVGGFLTCNLTTSWQRFAIAGVGDGVSTAEFVIYSPAGVNVPFSIYAWAVQVEINATLPPLSYIKSTDTFVSRASVGTYYDASGVLKTAAINVARMSFNPANLSAPPKLLLESAATNIFLYSEDATNIAWSKLAASVSGTATGPDGNVSSARFIIEDSTNAYHGVQQVVSLAAAVYTLSVFAKAVTRGWVQLTMGSASAFFNLSSGAIGNIAGCTAAITPCEPGLGFFRCSITFSIGAGSVNGSIVIATANGVGTYVGDGTSSILVYGAQLEGANAYGPTSYFKTTSASANRSADVSTSSPTTLTDYSMDAYGVVTLANAPLVGAALTWTGTFYYRCRFSQDMTDFDNFMKNLWSAKKVEFVSVKA